MGKDAMRRHGTDCGFFDARQDTEIRLFLPRKLNFVLSNHIVCVWTNQKQDAGKKEEEGGGREKRGGYDIGAMEQFGLFSK